LEKEVEEKSSVPENQASFRKGISTIDNVIILNVMQREKSGEDGKIYMLFMDLKAAFDKVLRKIGVKIDLVPWAPRADEAAGQDEGWPWQEQAPRS